MDIYKCKKYIYKTGVYLHNFLTFMFKMIIYNSNKFFSLTKLSTKACLFCY